MDKDKLAALRARYAGAKGGDIQDPAFAAVSARVFAAPDRRKWPFADPATLLDARFAPDAAATGFAGLDVALIGVPMDLGVTNRAGARLGPRAVRSVERIGPYRACAARGAHGRPRSGRRRRCADEEPLQSR